MGAVTIGGTISATPTKPETSASAIDSAPKAAMPHEAPSVIKIALGGI